jgi:serine/threonine-protein kinase
MTRCPSSAELEQWLADGLASAEAEAVESHVEVCAACQQALERLTRDGCARQRQGPVSPGGSGHAFLLRLERQPQTGAWTAPRQNEAANLGNRGAGLANRSVSRPPTVDDQGGAALDAPPGQVRVALVQGEEQQPTQELQTLLRKRLLIAALIILGGEFIGLPISLLGSRPLGGGLAFIVLMVVLLAVTTTVSGMLCRPLRSVRVLRVLELVLFGIPVLGFVALPSMDLRQGWFTWCARLGEGGMSVGARYAGLPWFATMVLYGVFIPNTWRRCAAVVGIMALAPLAVHTVGALADRAFDKGLLLLFLLEMSLWMAIGAAIAIYGSHRIEVLRQAAVAARKLGQYRLKQRLGAGGMGEVYLAEHLLLKRPCALKLIRPERAGDAKNLLRFEREVQTTASLTHPNTVEVFDFGHAADGTFYYAMEYLPGLSLEELVRRHGPLPAARVVYLLRQVCGALQEAHAAGLIHRDIKPGNVLVCQRGGRSDVAKLLDFGLVQTHGMDGDVQRLTQEGTLAGTPAYMSPEQAAGKADLDARSDLYSLGCVAYFLLAGHPPFVRDTAVRTLAAHLDEPPTPLTSGRPEVAADLDEVVRRCLAKDPAQRFHSADELDQALGQCCYANAWTRELAAAWWHTHGTEDQQRAGEPP